MFPCLPLLNMQALFLPVPEEALRKLPALFWSAYKGQHKFDEAGGDQAGMEHAGHCLVLVELRQHYTSGSGGKQGTWAIQPKSLDGLLIRDSEAVDDGIEAISRDMVRMSEPWNLRLKVELQGALREWVGPSLGVNCKS